MSFSQTLYQANQATWQASVKHRFVDEIFAGSLDNQRLARYLVQDYQFVDHFVALLGAGIASADNFASRKALAQFTASIVGDENDYFIRCFDCFGVSEQDRLSPIRHPTTQTFDNLLKEGAESRQYLSILALLYVAETLYKDWADQPERGLPPTFQHAEWITLHNNPTFKAFVAWLGQELDRVGELASEEEKALAHAFFKRSVEAELAFFDAVYEDLP
ncbi:TenA family transcriptional regulator [Pasteurellaceae bacterium RH1A]|nr:TenA family transcriptional regulator [Pasteurellaceae bacterium RH1A]